jgi:glutathione synthase/RimK-type ligase-like ATP-grasp enzyme
VNQLLILTRFPPEYEPQQLAEEARKKGIKPEIVNYQKIKVSKSRVILPQNLKLSNFDYVIPRSAAHRHKKSLLNTKMALIKALPEKTFCLNKKTYLRWPKLGKIKQARILEKNNLPTIPTLEKPVFPAILKAEFGSHSRRVVRVENQEQADKEMKVYAGKWIYQPLIKTPVYWRVVVLGNKSLGIMERKTNKR